MVAMVRAGAAMQRVQAGGGSAAMVQLNSALDDVEAAVDSLGLDEDEVLCEDEDVCKVRHSGGSRADARRVVVWPRLAVQASVSVASVLLETCNTESQSSNELWHIRCPFGYQRGSY